MMDDEYEILFMEEAETDLDAILHFIQERWPERIKIDFLAAVADKMKLLTTMPYLTIPYLYKASLTEPDVRACLVSRQVTMFTV